MTYHLTTLPGGLRVATETLPGMESVTVAVSVDVGARYEREEEGGLSHLLEHMAFKGTKRRSAQAIAEEMDMVGGNMNAYTSLETTVYYARVMKNDVPLAVDMLADIVQHSVFDEQELARERDVILQEIAMHYDTPDDLILDHFSATAYPDQPLGRSILGEAKRVARFTRKDILSYMRRHYHAHGMVVSAAGNVDHEAFTAQVAGHFTALSKAPHKPAPGAQYKGGEKRTRRTLEQLHLMLGFPAVSFHDKDYYAWQTLATLLGGGMSSRLFQEVREKRGLAYTVQAFVSSYNDGGTLGIYAATAQDKGPQLLAALCDEALKLQHGVSDGELACARNQIKAGLFMSRESTSSIAEWMGRHLLCYGRYKPAHEVAAAVDAVTGEDVKRISSALTAGKPTLVTLGPQKGLPKYEEIGRRLGAITATGRCRG